MKYASALIPLAVLAFSGHALAQGKIWRCGNTYTNDEAHARANACKEVVGGNVTVVMGTRINGANAAAAPAAGVNAAREGTRVANAPQSAAPQAGQRVDAADQKARDGEARTILEAELKKAEARQAELLKEYNNGEPEKLGPEHRNHQKYLDRVAEMKAALDRNERDIAGLRRELNRANGGTAAK